MNGPGLGTTPDCTCDQRRGDNSGWYCAYHQIGCQYNQSPSQQVSGGIQVNNAFKPLVPQGWQCPVCSGVFSPTTAQCCNCRGNK